MEPDAGNRKRPAAFEGSASLGAGTASDAGDQPGHKRARLEDDSSATAAALWGLLGSSAPAAASGSPPAEAASAEEGGVDDAKRRMQASLAALSSRLLQGGAQAATTSAPAVASTASTTVGRDGGGPSLAAVAAGARIAGGARNASVGRSGGAAINAAAIADPLFKDKNVRECYYFFNTGVCRLAEKCPYYHERLDGRYTSGGGPEAQPAQPPASSPSGSSLAAASPATSSAGMPGYSESLGMGMGMLGGACCGGLGMMQANAGLGMPGVVGPPLWGLQGAGAAANAALPGLGLFGLGAGTALASSPLHLWPMGQHFGGLQAVGMLPTSGAPQHGSGTGSSQEVVES